jgi:hypothetical protein
MRVLAPPRAAKRSVARTAVALTALIVVTFITAATTAARAPNARPFAVGERLAFVVSTNRMNKIGNAVMALSGPVDIRGTPVFVSSFETHIRVAMMNASNETTSWFDASSMTSFRFAKHEHRPLSSQDDSVEIAPERHRWDAAQNLSGAVASDHPLDELSFIYFLRTRFFKPDSTYSFERHYDARRNPTTVRVVKHETLQTRAGKFETTELEMHVKDGAEYQGEGVLHFWISDDACRLPVRIESNMPMLGVGILTLDSAVTPSCRANDSDPAPEKRRQRFLVRWRFQ